VADFSTNVTSGTAPLTVLFAATSKDGATSKVEEPTSWYWNFGDGTSSKDSVAVHTFTKPGDYTISLTVGNVIGNNTTIRPGYIVVTDPNTPVANFSSNVTEGYAPLTVQFNDLSQRATSRVWDFNGDGQTDSSDINPAYVYTNPGTYTVNLTVSNENGTDSKTAAINVLSPGSSSGGGGGAGSSPEPAKNVQVKEISQAFITNGKPVKFEFAKNATCVVYVSFDAKKTAGKTTTIAEQLKGKSALVSELPKGEVYKSFNIWVGTGGFATSKNMENPVVCFKVEKSWIQDKKIDPASITLNRYSDKKWEQLEVEPSGKDDKFLYFTAKTPGFSSFAITGNAESVSEENEAETQPDRDNETINKNYTLNNESKTGQKVIPSTSGFEIVCGVASLLAVLLCKRK
jgi:PGF-pre-PGF domain-containing protein